MYRDAYIEIKSSRSKQNADNIELIDSLAKLGLCEISRNSISEHSGSEHSLQITFLSGDAVAVP